MNLEDLIKVLDKGYVRLVDKLGSDVTVANAARVSYDKQVEKLSSKDERLIHFLANNDHTSPFRHVTLQFEIYAPLMIARQWFKYIAGSDHTQDAWNESSRRYITEDEEFYVPSFDEWRMAPKNSKQGSNGLMIDKYEQHEMQEIQDVYEQHVASATMMYQRSMELGMAPEQARMFLPAYAMYVRWYWTGSLQSVAHLIRQRSKDDAQYEFQVYADAVKALAEQEFKVSIGALLGGENT